jgi:hypothetical protein
MAMLQWGHAPEGVEDSPVGMRFTRNTARFNGATPMRAWKTFDDLPEDAAAVRLQWGHADEGVEKSIPMRVNLWIAVSLQWGHADEGVEDTSYQARATVQPGAGQADSRSDEGVAVPERSSPRAREPLRVHCLSQ